MNAKDFRVSDQTATILNLKNELFHIATEYGEALAHFINTEAIDDKLEEFYENTARVDEALDALLLMSIKEQLAQNENQNRVI